MQADNTCASTFAVFAPLLRTRGFRKTWSTRASGGRMDEWTRRLSDRELIVQLWEDGCHRISHGVFTATPGGRAETTRPTQFATETELDAAIEAESTRQDNKYLHYTPTTDVISTDELRELLSLDADDDMSGDDGDPGRISVCAGAWFKETDHRWCFWQLRDWEART